MARFDAGTRASQVQSRKQAIEKLQLDDLKRSNIAAAVHQVRGDEAVGQADAHASRTSPRARPGVEIVPAPSPRSSRKGEKVAIIGKNGVGKTTLVQDARRRARSPTRARSKWGHEASVGYLAAGPGRHHPPRTPPSFEWLRELDRRAARTRTSRGLLGRMLFSGEERHEADRDALRRRGGAPPLRQADADQGQRARPRRADQPPRPRVDRGAGRGRSRATRAPPSS